MLKRFVLPLLLAFALAPAAHAAGGRYVFDGGMRAQRGQVTSALNASSFDWSLVPGQVVIHIGKGISAHAVAGQIWLDGSLLDAGRFSWGVVQHEYAHQVDFGLLTDPMRTELDGQLQAGQPPASGDAKQVSERRPFLQPARQHRLDLVLGSGPPAHELLTAREAAAQHLAALIGHPHRVKLPLPQQPRQRLGVELVSLRPGA